MLMGTQEELQHLEAKRLPLSDFPVAELACIHAHGQQAQHVSSGGRIAEPVRFSLMKPQIKVSAPPTTPYRTMMEVISLLSGIV